MYSKVDQFVIPLYVNFVWTELPQIMTLVQDLVHYCQTRIGKMINILD